MDDIIPFLFSREANKKRNGVRMNERREKEREREEKGKKEGKGRKDL